MVDYYIIEWDRDSSVGCSNKTNDTVTVDGAPSSYDIEGLEEGNAYRVRVLRAVNTIGSSGPSNTVTATTNEKGKT